MDFTNFNASLAKLGTDLSVEVQAARDAITAAIAAGGDPTALNAAQAALDNMDAAVQAATAEFQGTSTGTVTSTP